MAGEGVTRRAAIRGLAAGAMWRATGASTATLSNEFLSVEFLPGLPIVRSYLHRPSGSRFGGATADGELVVNGTAIPWRGWTVTMAPPPAKSKVRYELRLKDRGVAIRFDYALEGYVLALEVSVGSDPGNWLHTIEWEKWPLVTCTDPETTVWRQVWTERGWEEKIGRGLWRARVTETPMRASGADAAPQPTVYCCAYQGKVCAAVVTNYPYMPIRDQVSKGQDGANRYAVSLNTYQSLVGGKRMKPLQAKVAFLPDLNKDGRADASDFQLWVNRQLPGPAATHKRAIWYKIFCARPGKPPETAFAQAREIIERIHRFTDGLPQIAYLVGWQYEGHDTGYPSLDKINTALGSREDLRELHRYAKERLNTVVSYHINLDDAYREHPGWDPAIITRQPDGELGRWEVFNGKTSYHISHTKDVESGKVFQRLNAMMKEVPVETAIHIDAFRNMNWSWEPGGIIGAIDELERGVKPIVEFFRSRGIDVTTESIDSDAAEWCGIVSGVWHMADPLPMLQLRHGKMLGGGRIERRGMSRWGLGTSLNGDVRYSVDGADYLSRGDWDQLLDDIYLGTLLYHFYVEREMTQFRMDEKEIRLGFADGVTTVASRDNSSLDVTLGDIVIAHNYDRFIPRGEAIYAYSRDGSKRRWTLPAPFRNKTLEVRTLGAAGGAAISRVAASDGIDLELRPRTPVKLAVAAA
jgi:hypothetical protein